MILSEYISVRHKKGEENGRRKINRKLYTT